MKCFPLVLQESEDEADDDTADITKTSGYAAEAPRANKVKLKFTQRTEGNRLSQSSLSENCSSPNEQYDDLRPSFDGDDNDNGEGSMRPSFQDTNDSTFYNKNSNQTKELDDTIASGYSEKSKRMMSNMGFKPGKGLGKYEHGRVEPIEASTQKGRRGLGLKPSIVGEISRDFKWTPDDAKPEAKEEVVR